MFYGVFVPVLGKGTKESYFFVRVFNFHTDEDTLHLTSVKIGSSKLPKSAYSENKVLFFKFLYC